MIANFRNAVGYGNGGKFSAFSESVIANACHFIGFVLNDYFLGNHNFTHIFIIHKIMGPSESNLQLRIVIYVIIINGDIISILNFNIVGTHHQRQQNHYEEK